MEGWDRSGLGAQVPVGAKHDEPFSMSHCVRLLDLAMTDWPVEVLWVWCRWLNWITAGCSSPVHSPVSCSTGHLIFPPSLTCARSFWVHVQGSCLSRTLVFSNQEMRLSAARMSVLNRRQGTFKHEGPIISYTEKECKRPDDLSGSYRRLVLERSLNKLSLSPRLLPEEVKLCVWTDG